MRSLLKHILLIFFLFAVSPWIKAQYQSVIHAPDTTDDGAMAQIQQMWDELQHSWYAKIANYQISSQISMPDVVTDSTSEDSAICLRLEALLNTTVFPMVYNSDIKRYINLYTKGLKSMSLILARAKVYFPMFEQILDKYNVPLELKYLAVIESALRPESVSRAGATGLWQFMYGTGKLYGLEVTTYVDDRMNPLKSTDAAARHLYDLSEMYDGNWPLVLAAYNCGPGNVAKAIKRSGGATDFWKIYDYLPRETRGYVPAFYAAMYAMKYCDVYSLTAAEINVEVTDTVMIYKKMDFQKISDVTQIPLEEIKYYNPQYKRGVIPTTDVGLALCLPVKYLMLFENCRDSIYKLQSQSEVVNIDIHPAEGSNANGSYYYKNKYHVVKSGESCSLIARKYGITLDQLMKYNKRKSTLIHPGDRLIVGKTKVYLPKKETSAPASEQTAASSQTDASAQTATSSQGAASVQTAISSQSAASVPSTLSSPDSVKSNSVQPEDSAAVIQKSSVLQNTDIKTIQQNNSSQIKR